MDPSTVVCPNVAHPARGQAGQGDHHAIPVTVLSRVDEGYQRVEAVGKRIALPAQRSGLLEGNLDALPQTGSEPSGRLIN